MNRRELAARVTILLVFVGIFAAVILAVYLVGVLASATPGDKVTICHATSSESNPYTSIDVDSSAVDELNNPDLNGHGDHAGDIVPPFGDFPGLNWTEEGQAIWENGCNVPEPPATPSPPTGTASPPPPVTPSPPTGTATPEPPATPSPPTGTATPPPPQDTPTRPPVAPPTTPPVAAPPRPAPPSASPGLPHAGR